MVKILFLIENLSGGGAEKALQNLVNRLDSNTFSVTVQTVQPGNRDALAPHVAHKVINRRGSKAFALWLRLCAALGLAYPLYIRGDYDIEAAFLESFPTKLLSYRTNKDILRLAWVHCDMDRKPGREKMARWYRNFDRVICVSEGVRRSFLRYFSARTAVLPNVIDGAEIREKSLEFTPKSSDFVAVGRLSPEKGFDRLIDACALLRREGFDFTLHILGDGPERQALESQIAALGLTNVTLLGYRENPYPYMAAARAVVIPSRTEGCSTVAAEALALGRAVVATPCAGMAELLGPVGIIAEDSVPGIAAGMKRILSGDYEAAAAEFSAEDAVRKTEDLLLAALREKRG